MAVEADTEQGEALRLDSSEYSDAIRKFSVAEAVDHIGFGRYQVALTVYAGCVWAADAMEMMLLSFLGPAVRCEWNLSPRQESIISTVVFMGAMAGAYSWGALSDSQGRRVGFVATAVFTFIFGILSALAPSYGWLLLFRAAVGVGLGGAHVAFTLAMELTPTHARSLVLVAVQGFWTLGSMLEAGLAWAVLSGMGWRWLLGLSSIPLLMLLLLFPIIPESPYYLAVTGQQSRAEAVLHKVAHVNKSSVLPGVLRQESIAEPAKAAEGKQGGRSWHQAALSPLASALWGLYDALGRLFAPSLRRSSAMLMVIWFANALTYYGLVLLTTTLHASSSATTCGEDRRLRLTSKEMAQIFITSTAELPGLIVAAVLADLLGRKRSIALGLLCISGFTLSLLWAQNSVVLLFGGRASSMGAFTVLFIYTPEVYPTKVRSFGLGCNNALSRLGAILAPYLAVDLAQQGRIGVGLTEGIIAGMCLIAAACVVALPLETSGQPLQVDAARGPSEDDSELSRRPSGQSPPPSTPPGEEAENRLLPGSSRSQATSEQWSR